MSDKPMYAVFLHPQAVETLGEAIKPYLAPGDHAPHLVCSELDTGGALCEMLLVGRDASGNAVEVELMLPLAMILLVVSVRGDGAQFGFRGHLTPAT
ncbi:hypothetical protein [Chiayiivirga flava]|uniref:Uncharacterized protein n=1 Tax=Chiayiivirga flava TaxID=659595 RepID=A0A7W8D5G4_9GAMM|nr:hypothetical protein [Chiayiivirga flava]MBB5208274.1 hypothetical protein [Chiayiivirga flava]